MVDLRNKEQELIRCRGERRSLSSELEKERNKSDGYHHQNVSAQVHKNFLT